MDLKKHIIDKSKDLNIDIIGFTDNNKLDLKDYLIEKRKNAKYTSFEEKNIEKRIDPKLTMENVKSIIVVGISYNTDFKAQNIHPLNGEISMSSWGLDYHRVLNDKMVKLIGSLKKEISFEYKAFVDTGPLVDRELARKAGLGFYGKNCSIINDKYGSFIFLGYILTNMEIKPDIPVEDDCGDCDLCLKACPTGALETAYNINPNRCISYLTQTKDIIPVELRQKMGRSIYGCDICQRVCPRNKDIRISQHKEFIPKVTEGAIDLEELLFISNRNFKNKFGSISASWRGRNTLKRNAIIAIGNMGDESNIPILLKTREDSNPILYEYIDEAIGKSKKNFKNQSSKA